ncbi:MAG: hypothetical protein CM15mV58_670 [uncultured marine virus]|nr:MAG: hypothetical protein CM15mV58_670 [uncultured marine virus]
MIDFQAGDDTTNKDDGTIDFYTTPSGGSLVHRMRIDHNGDVIMEILVPLIVIQILILVYLLVHQQLVGPGLLLGWYYK